MTEEAAKTRWTSASAYPDMWLDPAQDPRYTGVQLTGERDTLLDYLRTYRLTLQAKCDGLSPQQLAQRSVPPSTMSLLGLVRHLAEVERSWFRRTMAGQDAPRRWPHDLKAGIDGSFDGATGDQETVDEAWAFWREEVAFAEQYVAAAPDLEVRGTMNDGDTLQLREVLVHMIEEYARHCGHADLLRERIDGRVGQ
jgi:uncharacterized damage-inducible protein DinB